MKNAPLLHRVEHAVYLGAKGLLRALPHGAARGFGRGLGALAWRLLGGRRRVTLANLELAFPELPERRRRELAAASFGHLGAAFCDALSAERFDAVELCRRLTLEGWEHLEAARARGRGVVVMSAHLGMWEAAAQPVALYAGGMEVVGRPLDNPLLDRDLVALRTRFGNRLLAKRGAARGMLRALRRGGTVGILIDQRAPPADSIEVPFFGHPARTAAVLARLCLRTGAAVVPIFGYGEPGGRYRVLLRPPLLPPSVDPADAGAAEAAIFELTRRYLEVVEAEIRTHPEQWMWMHDRWKR